MKSYKIHIQEKAPEEQWFVVENTPVSIVDRDTFAKAQDIMKRDTRTAPEKREVYLLSGVLRCADRERATSNLGVRDKYVCYQCGAYKDHS